MHRIPSGLALAGALAIASSANAAQTIYTSRTGFNVAAGGGMAFESFETQRNGQTVFYPGVSVSETGGSFNLIVHTSNNATFSAGTTAENFSIWYSDNGPSVATFSFAAPITAFGVDIAGSQSQTAIFGNGISGSLALGANTPAFFGVISDTPFTSVTVNVSGAANVGFDALAFGLVSAAVPEPSAWALLILGFGAIGGAMRTRHKQCLPTSKLLRGCQAR